MLPPRQRPLLFGPTTDRDRLTVADILREETVGGALLLTATVAALLWANLAPTSYELTQHLAVGPLSLQHWAADGLLTIFFFVAGLELKRELTCGSLAQPSRAVLPIVAAGCGMAVPALIFLGVNLTLPGGHPRGWAIPMATDIAFALAVLAVVGRSLPASLRAFLLTLAIVDDLGAILVIAVVFTSGVSLAWLAAAAAGCALWWLLQRRRITGWYLYLPLALVVWWCTHESGVHATIAGVTLGLLSRASDTDPHAPVEAWEHQWRPMSAGLAVPVFALLSAGVLVDPDTLRTLLTEPVAIGIVAGLVLGKTVGIFGGAWLTARFTRAELAAELLWREVLAVAVLGGVGFTVSLLISDLAFGDDPVLAAQAKAAVLAGSVIAAIGATVLLRRRSRVRDQGSTRPTGRTTTSIGSVRPTKETSVAPLDSKADNSAGKVSEIIANIREDVKAMVQGEVELAKAELVPSAKAAGIGVGLFVGAALFAVSAFSVLLTAAALGIYAGGLPLWLSFLIIGAALLIIGGLLGAVGFLSVKKAKKPDQTIAEAQRTVVAVRGALARGTAAAKAPQIEGHVER